MKTRRELLTLLGAAAFTPRAVLAQSKQPVLIGLLNGRSRKSGGPLNAAFREGLAALGLKEGSQVVIEERWAEGRNDQLPSLAEELAAKRPAIIVADSTPSARAATNAAPRTPIVVIGGNPVAAGLAAGLARRNGRRWRAGSAGCVATARPTCGRQKRTR